MRRFVLSLLAATALSPLAHAADLAAIKPAAPTPTTFNWGGVYGGLQAGGAFGETNVAVLQSPFNVNVNNSGVFGGAFGGYNFQIDHFVVGVEGEFNVISNKAQTTENLSKTFYTASVYSNWFGSIDGRLGYAWKNYLIYAAGGYSFLNNGTTIAANGAGIGGQTQSLNGFNVGGGVEYAFTPNWAGRLEYRYYGYDRVTNGLVNAPSHFSSEYPVASTVRIGVSYRWTAAEAAAPAAKY